MNGSVWQAIAGSVFALLVGGFYAGRTLHKPETAPLLLKWRLSWQLLASVTLAAVVAEVPIGLYAPFNTWMTVQASALTLIVSATYSNRAWLGLKKAPHVAVWRLLTIVTGLACLLQLFSHAGIGTLVLAITTCFNGLNWWIGKRKRGSRDITLLSKVCTAIAILAVMSWVYSAVSGRDPIITAILLTFASVLSFLPNFERLWKDPESEVQKTYWVNTFRYMLATLAVVHFGTAELFSVATTLYPATWILVNGVFSLFHAWCLRPAHLEYIAEKQAKKDDELMGGLTGMRAS